MKLSPYSIQDIAMRALRPSLFKPYVCSYCRQRLQRSRRQYASSSTKLPEIYDVVCVGGGPAGLSLLTALSMSYIDALKVNGMLIVYDYRGNTNDIKPQNCLSGRQRLRSISKLEATAKQVFKPCQLPHAIIGRLSSRDRSMATHSASSSAAVYRYGGMGRRIRLAHIFPLAVRERRPTEITATKNNRIYDRES